MTTEVPRVYTYTDVTGMILRDEAYRVFNRYRGAVTSEDVAQQMWLWLLEHDEKIRRWLANDPQQMTRVRRSLRDAGRRYCERERAERLGFSVDDVYWFTPNAVAAIMPLVLDDTFVQSDGAVTELVTAVLDVRRVLTPALRLYFLAEDEYRSDWDDKIAQVVNLLGGRTPFRRRRAQTNASAQVQTRREYAGE